MIQSRPFNAIEKNKYKKTNNYLIGYLNAEYLFENDYSFLQVQYITRHTFGNFEKMYVVFYNKSIQS